MAPNPYDDKPDHTVFIDGAKPQFKEHLRISVDPETGTIWFGARGWSKELNRGGKVSLQLTPHGLAQLAKKAQEQLQVLQEA